MEFSQEQIKAVMGSKEGQRLIQLLQTDGGKTLSQAAAELRTGNTEGVKSILRPVTESPEVAQLLRQIHQRHG